jgi:hypothetical protein
LDDLLAAIDYQLGGREQVLRLVLRTEDGAGHAWAHRYGRVIGREARDSEVTLLIAADPDIVDKFTAHFGDQVRIMPADQRRRA